MQLNASKSKRILKWKPLYNTRESVKNTAEWYYKVLKENKIASQVTNDQIKQHMNDTNWK